MKCIVHLRFNRRYDIVNPSCKSARTTMLPSSSNSVTSTCESRCRMIFRAYVTDSANVTNTREDRLYGNKTCSALAIRPGGYTLSCSNYPRQGSSTLNKTEIKSLHHLLVSYLTRHCPLYQVPEGVANFKKSFFPSVTQCRLVAAMIHDT